MSRKVINVVTKGNNNLSSIYSLNNFEHTDEAYQYNESIRLAILDYVLLNNNTFPIIYIMEESKNNSDIIVSYLVEQIWIEGEDIFLVLKGENDFPYLLNESGLSIVG